MLLLLLIFDSLDLFIDARNTGEWTRCAQIEKLDLPQGWLEHAHIGVTATTGQLADNHDVISLQTYTEPATMEKDIQQANFHKFYTPKFNDTHELRLLRVENTLDSILAQLDFVDHHSEHEFMTMRDALDNLKSKIDSLERKEGGSDNVKDIVDKVSILYIYIVVSIQVMCYLPYY